MGNILKFTNLREVLNHFDDYCDILYLFIIDTRLKKLETKYVCLVRPTDKNTILFYIGEDLYKIDLFNFNVEVFGGSC